MNNTNLYIYICDLSLKECKGKLIAVTFSYYILVILEVFDGLHFITSLIDFLMYFFSKVLFLLLKIFFSTIVWFVLILFTSKANVIFHLWLGEWKKCQLHYQILLVLTRKFQVFYFKRCSTS